MTTRAHRARTLALAFLRNTDCKAVPIDGVEKVMMSVERFGERMIFHFVNDDGEDRPPVRTSVGDALPVRFFVEVQHILERRRWRPGLLDV